MERRELEEKSGSTMASAPVSNEALGHAPIEPQDAESPWVEGLRSLLKGSSHDAAGNDKNSSKNSCVYAIAPVPGVETFVRQIVTQKQEDYKQPAADLDRETPFLCRAQLIRSASARIVGCLRVGSVPKYVRAVWHVLQQLPYGATSSEACRTSSNGI